MARKINLHPKNPCPSKTKRFCDLCQKETVFVYNRNVLHSECKECGYRSINI